VITVVINDDGGTLGVGDFPAALTTTFTQTIPGVGASGVSTVVNPGTFSVAGNTSTTYTLTPSGDCSGTVNYGQNKVCTLTYNDPPATSSTPPAPPAPPTPPPAPPAPTPTVLGATDDLPVPEVLGATTDELPRTGSGVLPMMLAGLTAAAAAFVSGRKNKN
jgi:LPXTG-motif cell wall-anchored protein